MTLWWPECAPGYRLESTSDLTPRVFWQLMPKPVVQTNSQFRVSVVASNPQMHSPCGFLDPYWNQPQ